MTAYLIRRTLHAVIVLFGVSLIVFLLLHLLPGGPARASLGVRANPASIKPFNAQYGLNQPLPVQYVVWISQVLRGNLGFSYKLNQSVDSLLVENIPRTLVLTGSATVIAIGIAVPMGLLQAVRRNSAVDYVLTGFAFIFYSMPSFFLGLVLIIVFSDDIPILPSTGPMATASLASQIPNLVLPVATLTLITVALFSRYMRSAALDNLAEDYVRTAKAKGASNPSRPLPACTSQRPAAGHHVGGAELARHPGRRFDRRIALQLSGHGLALLECGPNRGLPSHVGHQPGGGPGSGPGIPAGRYSLRSCRP